MYRLRNGTKVAKNLATGTYDLIVLDVLRDGPNCGYGIRKRIFKQSKGTLNWQDGTIYPVLHHLEKQGLVTSHWKGPKDGGRWLGRGPITVGHGRAAHGRLLRK